MQVHHSAAGRSINPRRRRAIPRPLEGLPFCSLSPISMVSNLCIKRTPEGITITGIFVNRLDGREVAPEDLGAAQTLTADLGFSPPRKDGHKITATFTRGLEEPFGRTKVNADGTFRIETEEVPPGKATLLFRNSGPASLTHIGRLDITIPEYPN